MVLRTWADRMNGTSPLRLELGRGVGLALGGQFRLHGFVRVPRFG